MDTELEMMEKTSPCAPTRSPGEPRAWRAGPVAPRLNSLNPEETFALKQE